MDTSTLSAWRMPTSQRCIVGAPRRNVERSARLFVVCAGASAVALSGVTRGAGEPADASRVAPSASAVRDASACSIAASSQDGREGDNQSPRALAADGEQLLRVVVLGVFVVVEDQLAGHCVINAR